jgi:hypothetical protein
MVQQLVAPWRYDLTTYMNQPGFRRLKAKPSGNSLITPDGLIQSSVRVYVREPAEISTGDSPNPEYDSIYVIQTLWMNERCFVHAYQYPTGAHVAMATREREKDAVLAVIKQIDEVEDAGEAAK